MQIRTTPKPKQVIAPMASTDLIYNFYIYDDVKADSYDWWTGEKIKSETSSKYFRTELEKIPANATIRFYINSLGGSVMEGIAIYNIIKRHPARKEAYIDGFACSIASVIPMACDVIYMPRNALMMIHHAWCYAVGNSTELRKTADDLDIIDEASNSAYLAHAGDKLDAATLTEMLDTETWVSAEKCIQFGLADEYVEDIDIEEAQRQLQETQQAASQMKQEYPAAARVEQIAAKALEVFGEMAILQSTASPTPLETST